MGGLIPACAGKTPLVGFGCIPRWAHPRVCGENSPVDGFGVWDEGSSPRVRGKQDLPTVADMLGGLIPACAGKTPQRKTLRQDERAHPRVCGENQDSSILDLTGAGSSPRVRGKRR